MDKRFLSILGAIVVIFVIIFAVSQHKSSGGSSNSSGQVTHHVEGSGSSGVTLQEYGDYECPICEEYYPTVKQVAAQFSDKIYFQFSNLPLTQIHPNAFSAARAAEAAGLQGKFWQMHDALYEHQNDWVPPVTNPQSKFDQYAKDLGLNVSKFDQDYASSQVNDAVNADLNAFLKTGLPEATPTFFLDGKYISNDQLADSNGPSVSKFAAVINAEITKKASH